MARISISRAVAVGQAAVADLANSMSSTTTDGTLEDIIGVGSVSEAAVERNLSELTSTVNMILARLRAANVIQT